MIYNEAPSLIKPMPTFPPTLSSSSTPWSMNMDMMDPEIGKENQVEVQHRMLARSHRNGFMDRQLKPNSKTRDELQAILNYPTTQLLSMAEKDLVWNYRFHLSRDKKALTKFFKSVTWNDPVESKQAVDLLMTWASPDMDDVLELLGPEFENNAVRVYAVKQLGQSEDDEELALYLLQLVQALKFEGRLISCLKK
ncbi:Phosphatidylinositol (PI) 3-kinase [Coelomomyces lativittatus]|nr:Phosphatidylinositol (PI) 3-kinase [Coelomomyces lativittatus]